MKSPPAFQFYPADYLADEKTLLMTLEQEGCYIRLLCYCWREGSIPADPELCARLIGKGASTTLATVVQPLLEKCFQPSPNDPSRLVHWRLEEEREKQRLWREKSSLGGKKSSELRKTQDIPDNGGSRVVQPARFNTRVEDEDINKDSSLPIFGKSENLSKPEKWADEKILLLHLNAEAGRDFRAVETHLDPIRCRLADCGGDVEGVKQMLSRQVKLWRFSEMEKHLTPETLFRKSNFQKYYDDRNQPVKAYAKPGGNGATGNPRNDMLCGDAEQRKAALAATIQRRTEQRNRERQSKLQAVPDGLATQVVGAGLPASENSRVGG